MGALVQNNEAVGGTAFLTIDGVTYELVARARYRPAQVERTTAKGMDGIHGFIEAPIAPMIAGQFRDRGGMRVRDFGAMRDVTIVLELVSGKVVTGAHMWSTTAQEVDASDGTFEAVFEGGAVSELRA